MLVGVKQHPSFSPQTYFDYETLYLVQCFSTSFGICSIFKMHRGMWPGYPFSRFHEHFWHLLVSNRVWHLLVTIRVWHFAHFRNAQKLAIRSYTFLVFMSVFGILPIFEMHRGMCSGHTFFSFSCATSKKLSK